MAYWSLAAAYGMVALVALVQLARIHRRVPEYGCVSFLGQSKTSALGPIFQIPARQKERDTRATSS
ncbi:tobamovirus multiplication protein [bacterium]|nr:tobamovirus multiplication protein [bacterium]